jgi:predicted secreted hydrolase
MLSPHGALRVFLIGFLFWLALPHLVALSDDSRFRTAVPGYQYQFPRDHGSHEQFQTEWWYYTGHLRGPGNRTYGYELTFFRRGIASQQTPVNPSQWSVRNLYFAHFAVTDEGHKQFRYAEKVSREGLGKAGADIGQLHVWIDAWHAKGVDDTHHLYATDGAMAIDFSLVPEKPAVVHGEKGISKKGTAPEAASHYYSFTRMKTLGQLTVDGHTIPVTGMSWMDHEFGSHQLGDEQVGWDWFSVQFDDGSELMFYHIRRQDGSIEPASAGTSVNPDGSSTLLSRDEINLTVLDQWQSPNSHARYPARWRISVPSLALSVEIVPSVPNQELVTSGTGVTYWEGSAAVTGVRGQHPIQGLAYVELTGYASSLHKRL